jgi:glucosamine kinase
MTGLLVGADVGGTATRVAIADQFGTVLAVSRESAGNPNSVGVAESAARINAAMTRALQVGRAQSAFPPDADVQAIVLGMAGYGTAIAAGPEFLHACSPDGIAVKPRIVSDLSVAYASGSSLPRGYVVIAGTGSGAAEIDRGEIVARRGAWGWLLGDEGGGFWLGREAVRHALAEVERGGPRGDLTRQVIRHFGIDTEQALAGLTRLPYQQPAVRLAELAPLVTGLVDADPAAVSITARAAAALAELVLDLDPRPGRPIVATGSVLQTAGPIRQAFSERISAAIGSPVIDAGSGLVGALWLAAGAASQTTSEQPDPGVHARLAMTIAGPIADPIAGPDPGPDQDDLEHR